MIDAITLDHLRILVAVSEEGSFSAAGRRLGRVQSAISQSMQSLEANLGVQLFDRSQKTPRLTESGKSLLIQARQVLAEAAALRARAVALGNGMEPELRLAVDNLFPTQPLLASLRALQQQFPDLPVTLYTEPIFAAERRLREGSAHIALCGLRPGQASDLVRTPVTHIEMLPVAAPDHPLAKAPAPVSREQLSRHIQLLLTDPAASPDGQSYGVLGTRVWRFVDLGIRLEFLRAGFGWCNMPTHLVAPIIARGELTVLRLEGGNLLPPKLPMYSAYVPERPLGPAGRWFLRQLEGALATETT